MHCIKGMKHIYIKDSGVVNWMITQISMSGIFLCDSIDLHLLTAGKVQ